MSSIRLSVADHRLRDGLYRCPTCRSPFELVLPDIEDLLTETIWEAPAPDNLTPIERRMYLLLSMRLGQWVHHGATLRLVWGPGYEGPEDAALLKAHATHLRKKLAPLGLRIESRVGAYRMVRVA